MSRVGKLPISIPSGVTVSLDHPTLNIKGPLGVLARPVPSHVDLQIDQGSIKVIRKDDSKESRAKHGLARALIFNMVHGVSQGFVRALEIQGTGYRAEVQSNILSLNLGYSHPIQFPLPQGIKASVEKQTVIRLEGIDRELLGQTAARIKDLRPVEPYKGKGVRYSGEHVVRKVGKAGSKK